MTARLHRDSVWLTSVIIPVYNAERYVARAVRTAVAQPGTGEVILIEDASLDNSLSVCEELTDAHNKVRLLQHPDKQNHGAGASRNLGIAEARFPYIAFLHADDFFLPNRFSVPEHVLGAAPDVDGVYEAVGVHFESEAARRRWVQRGGKMLTTMTRRVPPDRLFEEQAPLGRSGYAPTCGWVVRRFVFDKTGMFDEHLRLHQDTAMFIRFAALGKMVPGRLDEPVAMRGVHDHNRITAPRPPMTRYTDRLLMWATVWRWGKERLRPRRQLLLMRRFLAHAARPIHASSCRGHKLVQSARQLAGLLRQYPGLMLDRQFWQALLRLSATRVVPSKLSSSGQS